MELEKVLLGDSAFVYQFLRTVKENHLHAFQAFVNCELK